MTATWQLELREWTAASSTAEILVPVQSRYFERVWLPMLGPSATLALRLLAELVTAAPASTVTMPAAEASAALGLGSGTGARSSLQRTMNRLERHRCAKPEQDAWLVRTALPVLSPRDVERLPPYVREVHDRMISEMGSAPA